MLNDKKYKNKNRGTALYITVIITTIFLAMSLGLTLLVLGPLKLMREMGYSVIAFYAADAGIEKVLTQRENPLPLNEYSEILANDSSYVLLVFSSGQDDCTAPNFCIKSIGTYKEVRRAIEITY